MVGLVGTSLELLLNRKGHLDSEWGERRHEQVADRAIQGGPHEALAHRLRGLHGALLTDVLGDQLACRFT